MVKFIRTLQREEITLREAERLTGYASDYIGYLIRSEKIPGRRTVGSSAWVTTKEDVLEYARINPHGRRAGRRQRLLSNQHPQKIKGVFSLDLFTLLEPILIAALVLVLGFSAYLVVVFSGMRSAEEQQAALGGKVESVQLVPETPSVSLHDF